VSIGPNAAVEFRAASQEYAALAVAGIVSASANSTEVKNARWKACVAVCMSACLAACVFGFTPRRDGGRSTAA
jgi:hypothetical protein